MASLTTLYAFSGGLDGDNPGYGSLISDANGNLFGTTLGGGATGDGTVFELVNTGSGYTFQSLASLNYATTGSGVVAGLTMDAQGDLFGVAQYGGSASYGTVFELVKTGSGYTTQTLANFTGDNGSFPAGALVADTNGNLFGTTQSGGDNGQGTVFELVNTGTGYTTQTLASFDNTNGSAPTGALIMDAQGDLFGTTIAGGSGGSGTVFELVNTGSGYSLQTLANFTGDNGSYLYAGLTADAQGDLFGTTYSGGANGDGTVFELVKGASGYTLQTLASLDNGAMGGVVIAGVTVDAQGDVFGAAMLGGSNGDGTLFELVHTGSSYTFQTLHSFSGSDGGVPEGTPTLDANGNLIGATAGGVGAGDGSVYLLTTGTAPPTDASVHDGYVNAAHDTAGQAIGGTTDAGATVTIYDNGTQVGTAVADGSGAWTYQVGVLADGSSHSYAITSTDTGGNTGAMSAALHFTVDTSAPGQPAAPGDAGVSNGVVNAAHDTAGQTIGGTAEAGASVAVYDNGTQVATVVADGAGAWSYQVGALADGSAHSYAVTATDAAGNTSAMSAPLSFTVNASGPAQPGAPADGAVSNGYVNAAHDTAGQTIGGTVDAGAAVTIYDNGTQVGTAVADGSGAWTYQVGALADGSSHSYAVTATDAVGNTSAMGAALSFTIDTSAPAQPAAPTDGAVSNGAVNAAHDAAGQTIGGTTEAGASVAVYDNGTQVGTVTADGAGAWSYQVGALADGSSHSYAVTATDAAGNTSAMGAALAFTVDTSAPGQPAAPADASVSNGFVNAAHDTAGQTIGGTVEAGASVAIYDNGTQVGTAVADGSGAWTFQVGALADGSSHSYAVTATDAVGNTSAMGAALSFTVDTGGPAQPGAPADGAVSNGSVNAAHDTAAQTIGGTTEAGASVAVYDNGTQVGTAVADGSGAWTYQVGALADGSAHSYAVTATDTAGNISGMGAALSFTVDTSAPTQPAAPADAGVSNGVVNAAHDTAAQTIGGTVEAGASVAIFDNGTQVGTATADGSGAWTYQVGALADGSAHSYAVTATDAAGNTSGMGAALAFTVDTSAPVQPAAPADAAVANGYVNAVHDTAAQTIGGTTEAGASVSVYDNGTQVGTATADGAGAWSYQVGALADGSSHSYAVTATDAGGNTSVMGQALSFTVDTSAPAQPAAPGDAGVSNGAVNAAHDTASQTITGTTEAGASVAVYDNGTQVGTAVADGAGAWSYQVGALADGASHSYAVTATDAAGNTSAMGAALSFTVDTSAPAQPGAPADAGASNGFVNAAHDTAAQTIGGTTEAGASVAVYDNGAEVATVVADGSGSWTYQVGALADGSAHSYAVTATDAVGNTSTMGAALAFTVDTSGPGQPAAPADAAVANGYVNAAHDTAGQTIAGTTEAGASVAVYDNGTQVGTATADGSGAWTYQVGALADGSAHSYAVTATDAAGNTSAMGAALAFTVDTSAPGQPAAPADASISNGYVDAAHDTASQTITGTAEAGASVAVYDNGSQVATVVADGSGAWTYQVGALADGSSHSYAVSATDAAGNTSAMGAALNFVVGFGGPAQPGAPADGAVSNGYVNAAHDTASQTIGGTTEAGASVTVYDNGTQVGTALADGAGAWSYQVGTLADGSSHSYAVTATDADNNTSTMSGTLSFTVDTSAPGQPAGPADTAVANGYVNAAHDTAGQAIGGTVEAGASVAVYDNGTQIGTALADGSGAWSFQIGALADGSAHSYAVTATDAAGNTSPMSAALAFTVDASAPVQPGAPTDGAVSSGYVNAAHDTAGQAIGGATEADASVAIYDNGSLVTTVAADGSGAWSYQLGILADGSAHSFAVTATDAAGNTSALGAALTFTVDTTSPGQPASPTDASVSNGVVNAAHDTAGQAISGTTVAGASVAIYDNGSLITTVIANNSGVWTYQVGTLADGSAHSYAVAATDAAGNTGALSQALNFTVDASAPDAPGGLADTAISGGYVNAVADTAGQSLAGTAEVGALVSVYDNGVKLGTTTADAATGAWSFNLGVLANGAQSLTAMATDAAGNTSAASAALSFTVDTLAPASAVSAVTIGGDGVATVSGSAEAGSTVTLYDGGTPLGAVTAGSNGTWSYPVGVLAAGSGHSYTVMATDAAGNTSAASSALSYTAAAAPSDPPAQPDPPPTPATPTDSAAHNGYVNAAGDTASQKIGGTAAAGDLVTIYDHGNKVATVTANNAGAWSYKVGALANGSSHSYAITDTDAGGNVSAMSGALGFTVDTKPPAAPTGLADAAISHGYVNAARDTAGQTLTGKAEAGALVTVYDNGAKLGTTTADASTGAWTFGLGVLADGVQRLTTTATDAAGNVGATSGALTFTVNTDPPTPAVTNVIDWFGPIATIAGVSEAGSKVTVFDNGKQIGTVTTEANGTWNLLTLLRGNGVHQLTETAVDGAGNSGASTGSTYWSSQDHSHLVGGSGNDVLIGQQGDTLTGGAGSDHFVLSGFFGKETITDFTPGSDEIWLSNTLFRSYAQVMAHAHLSGGNTVITDAFGDQLTLAGVQLSALHATDFHFS